MALVTRLWVYLFRVPGYRRWPTGGRNLLSPALNLQFRIHDALKAAAELSVEAPEMVANAIVGLVIHHEQKA
jgi:hypothetical protein